MTKFKPQFRRLVFIDRKIREGKFPNSSTLAREYETSIRTIARDIEYLKDEFRAPIDYDQVRHGYYYTDTTWFLPSVLLSEGDLLALLIGQQAMDMYRGTPVAQDIERIFGKLAEFLPDRISIGPELIQSRMSFFTPPARPINAETWKVVLGALMHTHELEIHYRSAVSKDAKLHTIRPYHVVNLEGEWYLLAHEERWQELRQFALSRIEAARLLEAKFTIPETFDPKLFLRNRFGRYLHTSSPPRPVTVRLLVEPLLARHISEKIWHPDQRIRQRAQGRVELSIPVARSSDMESWILSLGEHVQVLAPTAFRESIRQRHRLALRKR